MSDQHPIGSLSGIDAAIAKVQAQMREADRSIEVLLYLDSVVEQVKRAFLDVATSVDEIEGSGVTEPAEVGDGFERQVIPLLEAAVADAFAVRIVNPDLAAIHTLATTALEKDLSAFRQLAQAYRTQNRQLLAAGAGQREAAAVFRRQWIERTLALGQTEGVYDESGQ